MSIYQVSKDEYISINSDDSFNPRETDELFRIITYNGSYSPDNYNGDFVDIVKNIYGSTHIEERFIRIRGRDGVMYYVKPVYIYRHGCIVYFSCDYTGYLQHQAWDSGLAGIIFTTEDKIKEVFHIDEVSRDTVDVVRRSMENSLNEYTKYCNGDIYMWTKFSFRCGELEFEGCCGGYYDIDSILREFEIDETKRMEYESVNSLELHLLREYVHAR